MLGAVTFNAQSQAFQEGNLVVLRLGDGTTDLINKGSKVFFDEYTPTGILVRSIELPSTNPSGPNFVLSGTNDVEGVLSRSPNGLYVSAAGYSVVAPHTGSVIGATSTDVPRAAVAISNSGSLTYVVMNDFASTKANRSAITTNGVDFWIASEAGVGYRNTSSTSTTIVGVITTPTPTNSIRTVTIADGNLYGSTTPGTDKIGQFGSGLPTTSATYTPLAGIGNITPHQFLFFDIDATIPGVDVLYVAEESTSTTTNNGGIRKYSLVGTTWTFNGKLGGLDKYRGLAGSASGSTVTLFAAIKGANGTGGGGALSTVVDATGYNETPTATPTEIASLTSTSKMAFRGVALAPVASALPISLKSFNAGVDGSKVNIWWSTFNEVNVKDFTIERSTDATSFERVGTQSPGNSNQLSSYTFTDANANAPVLYYRLKVTDKDGSISYSSVIKVSMVAAAKVVVTPNPAVGSNINVSHAKAGKDAVIRLFSFDGKMIRSIAVQNGSTQSLVDVNQLVKGNYIVEFADASGRSTTTFIKQ